MKKIFLGRKESTCRVDFLGKSKSRLTSTMAIASFVAMVAAASFLSGTRALAWGPNRPTFTMQNPADYVTFNSITDDPSWGDERGFAVIKDVTSALNNGNKLNEIAASAGFGDVATFEEDHTYMVKMFVHNNASANLNLAALNTRAMLYIPDSAGKTIAMQGIISSDSCGVSKTDTVGKPCSFWDEVYIKNEEDTNSDVSNDFEVRVVGGSVKYYNKVRNFKSDGFDLDTDGLTSGRGAYVGYDKMDGKILGCFDYSGYVTVLVKARHASRDRSYSIDKKARIEGTEEWKSEIDDAKPGDTIEYSIEYTNTGSSEQRDVIIKDSMAKNNSVVDSGSIDDINATGLDYIEGSTVLKNSLNKDGVKQNNDEWAKKGLNVGNYAGKSNAIVYYKAKVPGADQLYCGDNRFDNVASVSTSVGKKISTSTVIVKKECSDIPPVNDKPKTPENPGVPSAGVGVKTAVVSFVLFAISATVLVAIIVRNKKARR